MSNLYLSKLKKKISSKKSTIGIVGLGYVGLPLAIRFSEVGYKVIGFDVNSKKIKLLNDGRSFISHIDDKKIKFLKKNNFLATGDFSKIAETDVNIICVPTPIKKNKNPDLGFINNALNKSKKYFQKGQLLVLESTTYPGTTEEVIVPFLELLNYQIGQDYYVAYSPEREDPGNKKFGTKNTPKVIAGYTNNCTIISTHLYNSIVNKTVVVSSPRVAEFTKLMENIHRSVNIGIVNEMKIVAQKLNININEVINAASTKPFGFTPYQPGPGVGGHCIPVDPYYLSWKANVEGVSTKLLDTANTVNSQMPQYVFNKLIKLLKKNRINMKKAKILIIGMAYKKNIDDLRESPGLKILSNLLKKKISVNYSDPYISRISIDVGKKKYLFKSLDLNIATLKKHDLAIILTAHDIFNYKKIAKYSNLLVDTRFVMNKYSTKVINI